MLQASTVIIGGGAAGIVAAIGAKRAGEAALIVERLPKAGKKILASGNGRCNLLNEDLDVSHYNEEARSLVTSVLSGFDKKKILAFFRGLGLETVSEEGRIFPAANQSSSVLKVLELELQRLKVPFEFNFSVNDIARAGPGFTVKGPHGRHLGCKRLIIACGGRSYPALGSDGSLYAAIARLGHKIVEPVPSCVPLVVKHRLCQQLQGQKIRACVKAAVGGAQVATSRGDLLFTKYGLSGTAILDVSEKISIALNRRPQRKASLSVDMIPFMTADAFNTELKRRSGLGFAPEDMLAGLLPNKFCAALKGETPRLKDYTFEVSATRGWNEAEFTAGGVDTTQVREGTLESKIVKGVYFAGEVLDVCGARGGYNLAWAWASGLAAGAAGRA